MLKEERQREKVVIKQMKRAWNFEEKLIRGGGRKIAQACLRKILGRDRRGNTGYSKWEKVGKDGGTWSSQDTIVGIEWLKRRGSRNT